MFLLVVISNLPKFWWFLYAVYNSEMDSNVVKKYGCGFRDVAK
jgi:hypothetical protein